MVKNWIKLRNAYIIYNEALNSYFVIYANDNDEPSQGDSDQQQLESQQ